MLDISRLSQLPEAVELDALLVLLEWLASAHGIIISDVTIYEVCEHDAYRIKERIRFLFSRKNQDTNST